MKPRAPSDSTSAPFSGEDTTPMHSAPAAAHNWVAKTPRPPAAPQISTRWPGLEPHAVDEHAVRGEVRQPVGGRLVPREVLRLGDELLGLDLRELRERAPARLVAPDPLRGRGERVEAVDLGILVGRLVAVDDDLVARRPPGHARTDLPDDPGRVRAADVVVLVGVVAEDGHGLAERRPHVVEVHAGRHDADDDLERAGLRHLDLLDLERVDGLALALLADDPRRHRGGQLARLGVHVCHLRQINGHRFRSQRFPALA